MTTLSSYFHKFEELFSKVDFIDNKWYEVECGVTSYISKAPIKDKSNTFSEEFYRARFVWSLIQSGMYPKEKITLEGEDLEIFQKLYNMLDEIEDVTNIYHNVELD